jgi:hypothetical protein
MIKSKMRAAALALALALALMSSPVMATTSITNLIENPSSAWAGIDYWGVQASQFSMVDQVLTFNITSDSKIDIFMQGSSKFKFTDLLLNGTSIANLFTVDSATILKASGYAAAGTVSLRFAADYTCTDCWGDWFGGYVQVTQATLPVATPIPEPATWMMMIAGMALVGAALRRRKVDVSFG